MVNALTKVGESISFSAFTVIAALLSLLAATFQIYSNLGIPLAIGIGVMLLAGLTLLPALLAILGRWAFFPSRTFWIAQKTPVGVVGRFVVRFVAKPVRWVFNLLTFGGLLKLWRWWGNKSGRAPARTGATGSPGDGSPPRSSSARRRRCSSACSCSARCRPRSSTTRAAGSAAPSRRPPAPTRRRAPT